MKKYEKYAIFWLVMIMKFDIFSYVINIGMN